MSSWVYVFGVLPDVPPVSSRAVSPNEPGGAPGGLKAGDVIVAADGQTDYARQ